MIMSSNTVQLGQLTIITELGCTIGSAKECQMRIREENVSPRHIVWERTGKFNKKLEKSWE